MTELTIRPLAVEEIADFIRSQAVTFGLKATPKDVEIESGIHEPARTLGVFEGDGLVGGAAALSFHMTVPGGGSVPTAGVTSVGVHPTHRRRGVLTNLMRLQLDDVRERGEPLAALWASEGSIYGRFGYGMAAFAGNFSLARVHSAFVARDMPAGRVQLVGEPEALVRVPPIYEAERARRPGFMDRNEAWWRYVFADPEHHRDGFSAIFFAIHQTDGRDDAFATYRIKHNWEHHTPASILKVDEVMAATPEAYAAMWRYVFDVDLVGTIEAWPRPTDEPLLLILNDPRHLRFGLSDGLYLRVVEVSAALAARRYGASDMLVFGVSDPFCPWNEGAWQLEAGPDGASCTRTDREADLLLDATALGAAYLGGVSFAGLGWARRVKEGTPGALARADALFRSELAPWCPYIF
jgi:predicted acetyltransferase